MLAPRVASRASTVRCAPSPRATMVITAAMPITTPSVVRSERSLLARTESRATRKVSEIIIWGWLLVAPRGAAAAALPAAQRAAQALAHALRLLLLALLELGHRDQQNLLPRLEARDDLGVLPVAQAERHAARLRSARRLHEDDPRPPAGAGARVAGATPSRRAVSAAAPLTALLKLDPLVGAERLRP